MRVSWHLMMSLFCAFLSFDFDVALNSAASAAEEAASCSRDPKDCQAKREPLVGSVSEILKMPAKRQIQLFDRAVHIADPSACRIQTVVNSEIGTRSGIWNLSCGESRLPPDYAVMIIGTSRQKLRVLRCSLRQPVGFGCETILE